MEILDAIILGIVQGVTEFLPVSSTGHLIIAHRLLGAHSSSELFFDATLHLATLAAVLVYFRNDIASLIGAVWSFLRGRGIPHDQKGLMYGLVLGTIPAVVIGLLFEDMIAGAFRGTTVVAWGLIIGSILMYIAERKFTGTGRDMTGRLGWRLGWFQALALFPGISRSGATISGGLFAGLTRPQATRFAFLLSFPILLGGGITSMLKIIDMPFSGIEVPALIAAALAASLSGLAAIHFLIRFVSTRTFKSFIWYRLILAVFLLLFPF